MYALDVYYNLLLVLALFPLGFSFHLKGTQIDIYLNRKFFGLGQLGKGFFILEFDLDFNNDISLMTLFFLLILYLIQLNNMQG